MKNFIVPTNVNFNYITLMNCINLLLKKYSFLTYSILGKSVLNKDIPLLTIGNGPNSVFYTASFHAKG